MKRIQSWLRVNPIIVKELRSRMRGPRAFITLTITLLLTGAVMYGMLQLVTAMSRNYGSTILSSQVGQVLLTALAFLELVMVCAITPAVTAGAISGEREKQTYEMLQATPLSPANLVWGKLVSALSYVFLLLFAAVPLGSVVFIFGGVVARDMLKALLVLAVLAVAFGVLGLFMSALFGRTGRATVASFLIVMVLVFLPMVVGFASALVPNSTPARWMLAGSPIGLLLSTMELAPGGAGGVMDIFSMLGGYWIGTLINPMSTTSIPRPLYHYGVPFYAGLALVLYFLTTRLVQPARRWKLTRAEWITALGALVLFAVVVTGAFYATVNRYEWAVLRSGDGVATEAPAFQGPAVPVNPLSTQVEVTVNPALIEPTLEPFPTPTPTPMATPAGALPRPGEVGLVELNRAKWTD